MSNTMTGMVSGLTIGVVFAWLGALALFVGPFMLVVWIVSKIWMGKIDIPELHECLMLSRAKKFRRR